MTEPAVDLSVLLAELAFDYDRAAQLRHEQLHPRPDLDGPGRYTGCSAEVCIRAGHHADALDEHAAKCPVCEQPLRRHPDRDDMTALCPMPRYAALEAVRIVAKRKAEELEKLKDAYTSAVPEPVPAKIIAYPPGVRGLVRPIPEPVEEW